MRRNLIPLTGVALVLPSAAWAQAPSDTDRYVWGPHMMAWDGGWHAMFFGPLFMIFFLAVLITTTVLFGRWLCGPWHSSTPPLYHPHQDRTALDILKERFARGEIDKAEFEDRRHILGE